MELTRKYRDEEVGASLTLSSLNPHHWLLKARLLLHTDRSLYWNCDSNFTNRSKVLHSFPISRQSGICKKGDPSQRPPTISGHHYVEFGWFIKKSTAWNEVMNYSSSKISCDQASGVVIYVRLQLCYCCSLLFFKINNTENDFALHGPLVSTKWNLNTFAIIVTH